MENKITIVDENGNPVYNIKTGERITNLSTFPEISDALRFASEQQKSLEAIADKLKELLSEDVNRVFYEGEKTYQDYWAIMAQTRFDKQLFELKATEIEKAEYEALKDKIKAIEDKYKAVGKPFLKHPKM